MSPWTSRPQNAKIEFIKNLPEHGENFIYCERGSEFVDLDGSFTAQNLRDLAAAMEDTLEPEESVGNNDPAVLYD